MPVYVYHCEDCGAGREVWATLDELQRGLTPACELCGSSRMTRTITAPSLGTALPARASVGGCRPSGGGGRGCCG